MERRKFHHPKCIFWTGGGGEGWPIKDRAPLSADWELAGCGRRTVRRCQGSTGTGWASLLRSGVSLAAHRLSFFHNGLHTLPINHLRSFPEFLALVHGATSIRRRSQHIQEPLVFSGPLCLCLTRDDRYVSECQRHISCPTVLGRPFTAVKQPAVSKLHDSISFSITCCLTLTICLTVKILCCYCCRSLYPHVHDNTPSSPRLPLWLRYTALL